MEAITARQARKMVDKSLGKVESLEPNSKSKAQIELFEANLQEAIINKETSFEIQFHREFQKEAIKIIIDRGFSIWKVYYFKDKSRRETPLLYDGGCKSKEVACISYKFYF